MSSFGVNEFKFVDLEIFKPQIQDKCLNERTDGKFSYFLLYAKIWIFILKSSELLGTWKPVSLSLLSTPAVNKNFILHIVFSKEKRTNKTHWQNHEIKHWSKHKNITVLKLNAIKQETVKYAYLMRSIVSLPS